MPTANAMQVDGKKLVPVKKHVQDFPVVTITRKKFVFDRFFVENYWESHFKYANFYYDEGNDTIGIQLTENYTKDSFEVQNKSDKDRIFVYIENRQFIRTINSMTHEIKRARYKAKWDEENQMILVNLSACIGTTKVTSAR